MMGGVFPEFAAAQTEFMWIYIHAVFSLMNRKVDSNWRMIGVAGEIRRCVPEVCKISEVVEITFHPEQAVQRLRGR